MLGSFGRAVDADPAPRSEVPASVEGLGLVGAICSIPAVDFVENPGILGNPEIPV
jgi:hypothetical protein